MNFGNFFSAKPELLSTDKILSTGLFFKRGDHLKEWKTRKYIIVLRLSQGPETPQNLLFYCDPASDKQMLGVVTLESINVALSPDFQSSSSEDGFQIVLTSARKGQMQSKELVLKFTSKTTDTIDFLGHIMSASTSSKTIIEVHLGLLID